MANSFEIQNYNLWRWAKNEQYYVVYLQKNLLSLWSINKAWGCSLNSCGNNKTIICDTYEAAYNKISAIHKRRKARGYSLIQ